jgi:hypothetical protein
MFEAKPSNLSLKDFLIKSIAKKMELSEDVVDSVITHQFKNLLSESLKHKSLEISGLGKFLFRDSKAKKDLERIEGLLPTALKPEGLKEMITYLKAKI